MNAVVKVINLAGLLGALKKPVGAGLLWDIDRGVAYGASHREEYELLIVKILSSLFQSNLTFPYPKGINGHCIQALI